MRSCSQPRVAILHRLPGFKYAPIAAVVAAVLLPAAVRADVDYYAVSRYATYTQDSNAEPAAPSYWSLSGVVYNDIPDEVLSGTLSWDVPPPVTHDLVKVHPNIHQYFTDYYTDYAQYMLDDPATTYTLTVDRGFGVETGDVFLPEDMFCAEIPHLTGDTYDRLQSYDPSLDFDVTINGFTLADGTNVGSGYIVVVEEGVPGAAWLVDVQPGDTAFQIPAGQLLPSRNYSISIGYSNGLQTENGGFGTATSEAQFQRDTSAYFTTLPVSIPCEQWTVINLNPAGVTDSGAWSVKDGQQVGWTELVGVGIEHALLWSGTAESWIDLTPPGTYSYATGLDAGQQAGGAIVDGAWHASLWSGTADSWVDLHPAGSPESHVSGMDGGQQAGHARVDGEWHASLWTGTADSWVDLDPPGTSVSYGNGVQGGQQAGGVLIDGVAHASLWTGTAASWVDLSPAGTEASGCYGVGDGQQVGLSTVDGVWHASVWTGTADSWVDLHPVGADNSVAWGADGGQQAGEADVNGITHASLWSGTAASWVDLHVFLPAEFTYSYGRGIWNDGSTTYVVGFGFNSTTGYYEALMWVSAAAPCLGDMNCDGVVNSADAPLFVEALLTPAVYTGCDITRGDMNQDTFIDGDDTQLFVNAIAAP